MTGCMAKFSENIHHSLFSICHSHNPCRLQFPLPWLIGFFTGVIRRMPLVEQDLLSWPLVKYVLSICSSTFVYVLHIRVVIFSTFFVQNDVQFVFPPNCFIRGLFFIYVIYVLYITYIGVQHDFHSRSCLVLFETCSRHHEYIWNIIELMLNNIQLINQSISYGWETM